VAMVSVVLVAAYRQIWGSDRSAWSKGWQLPGAHAALARWTGWTLAVAVQCYDDSTINIVVAITIVITSHGQMKAWSKRWLFSWRNFETS